MWKIEYKKAFLRDLSRLPLDYQKKIEEIVFTELICENPYSLGYIQKLKGYNNKFKIRIGNYRIGLTFIKTKKTILCERVVNRKEIYRVFP
jgi:mRNA interferase RelE/StbE